MPKTEGTGPPPAAAEIGQRIRLLRDAKGMTQGALAARVFVTQPAVSQWERGETVPSRATQNLLADALNTTRSWLFKELVDTEAAAA